MEKEMHECQKFENTDFAEKKITSREFVDCEFINCNFAKSNLGNSEFIDCIFKGCNLSLATLEGTRLKNCQFIGSKMMGLDFSKCNPFLFSVSFADCHLDYCSFFRVRMKKTSFAGCHIKQADFSETDLSGAGFHHCDLLHTTFMGANLEKADLRMAINFVIDPELNKLKKARFSTSGLAGLLVKYDLRID